MRLNKTMHLSLPVLLLAACHCLWGAGGVAAQQTTTTAPRPTQTLLPPPPAGPTVACQKKVGILGNYFESDVQAFLVANGLTVTLETAATIAGGSLSNLDVLYINRGGTGDAIAQKATIEAWVRAGGVLITEFSATELLFNGSTFGFFPAATLDVGFGVPAGTSVCGGNTVNVTSPGNALAAGLPSTWSCSGDPIGVFKVYKESTLDPSLERVARIAVDQNGDGAMDPVVGTACEDGGAVVAFFTDFGDWTPLQNPRICPGGSCNRSIQDETLLLNAVCRVKQNCTLDHSLCYKVIPHKRFKKREVLVHNQFGAQYFTVVRPDLLCVPSTKKELKD
ncbi:MAG TPA: hypothetical protein VMW75_25885 [Thermoanaerobaculia bacterium]|nr:hypothetical protein [Thermoanaerobaculia bacterium]